jgi:hypothetical protein
LSSLLSIYAGLFESEEEVEKSFLALLVERKTSSHQKNEG